jgi:hypothetical protein
VLGDLDAENAEGLDRCSHRTNTGLRVPVHVHGARAQRRHQRHEPHHGPREAAVQADLLGQGFTHRQRSDLQAAIGMLDDLGTQCHERLPHEPGVAAVQGTVDPARARRDRREHQPAVRQ